MDDQRPGYDEPKRVVPMMINLKNSMLFLLLGIVNTLTIKGYICDDKSILRPVALRDCERYKRDFDPGLKVYMDLKIGQGANLECDSLEFLEACVTCENPPVGAKVLKWFTRIGSTGEGPLLFPSYECDWNLFSTKVKTVCRSGAIYRKVFYSYEGSYKGECDSNEAEFKCKSQMVKCPVVTSTTKRCGCYRRETHFVCPECKLSFTPVLSDKWKGNGVEIIGGFSGPGFDITNQVSYMSAHMLEMVRIIKNLADWTDCRLGSIERDVGKNTTGLRIFNNQTVIVRCDEYECDADSKYLSCGGRFYDQISSEFKNHGSFDKRPFINNNRSFIWDGNEWIVNDANITSIIDNEILTAIPNIERVPWIRYNTSISQGLIKSENSTTSRVWWVVLLVVSIVVVILIKIFC